MGTAELELAKKFLPYPFNQNGGVLVKKKIVALAEAISRSDSQFAKDDAGAVESLINDCSTYVEKVVAMESVQSVARFRMEAKEYQDLLIRLDRNRKFAHDSLIASVRLANRLCGVYEVEKVYDGPEERIAIAEYAMLVTQEFFAERQK